MANNVNTITEVSLNENENGEAVVGDVPLTPPASSDVSATETPKNTNDEDIDSLLEELHTNPNKDVTQEAVEKLRRATSSFTSTIGAVTKNIDEKFHVSSNAQQLDSKLGVSSTVSRTTVTVGNTVGNLLEKVYSSSATQSIQKSVENTVSKGTKMVGETVDRSGVRESMRDLDEKHGITQGTLGVLTGGMDLLNKTLESVTKVNGQGSSEEQDFDKLVSSSADDESDLKISNDQVKR